MVRRKSNPLSIRFDESDFAELGARAAELGVSAGALARSLITWSLQSEVDVQLEAVRAEIGSLHNQAALLRADVHQLNENLRETLKAVLCGQTGDENHAQEMAEEVVKALNGEE